MHRVVLGVRDNKTEKICSNIFQNLSLVEEAKPVHTKILSRSMRQNMSKCLKWVMQFICYSQGVLAM